MRHLLARWLRHDDAQDLIEYALLSSLLAVVCITGILEITKIKTFLEDVGALLQSAV